MVVRVGRVSWLQVFISKKFFLLFVKLSIDKWRRMVYNIIIKGKQKTKNKKGDIKNEKK